MAESDYACSLSEEGLAARRSQWRELDRRALLRSESVPGGRLLVYRGGPEAARILTALIDAERECCPWLGFSVESAGDEVRLTLHFPSEANATAAELGIARD